jgi:8-oxo-dGTP pyrophosphatase MutT (NUDIX family)
MITSKQVAALPVRRAKSGAFEILLVTSRNTGRWIIPKGWPSKRLKDHKAAAREAKEEAGVEGKIKRKAIGSYRYVKTEIGPGDPVDVMVYLLSVRKEHKRWPEKKHRQRAWVALDSAAEKVQEPELSVLLGTLPGLTQVGRSRTSPGRANRRKRNDVRRGRGGGIRPASGEGNKVGPSSDP